MEKRILITGGTGFIGQSLCQKLIADGHTLTVLSRQPVHNVQSVCGRVEAVNDLARFREGEGFDAVINLAGEGIADKRWSEARKRELTDSRIALTHQLVDVIRSWKTLPAVLVSGSAVGFYGDQGSHRVTEDTPPHDEFTHRMCSNWEQEALRLEPTGVSMSVPHRGCCRSRGGFATYVAAIQAGAGRSPWQR